MRSRVLLRGLKISGVRIGFLVFLILFFGIYFMVFGRSSKNYKIDVNVV